MAIDLFIGDAIAVITRNPFLRLRTSGDANEDAAAFSEKRAPQCTRN